MARQVLGEAQIHPAIRSVIDGNYVETIQEVINAIGVHDVVVVGMKRNPFPRRARKALDAAGIVYHYFEYGSYLSDWRKRTALKMWSGWPTIPMIFVKRVLVGGADDLSKLIDSGEMKILLATPRG